MKKIYKVWLPKKKKLKDWKLKLKLDYKRLKLIYKKKIRGIRKKQRKKKGVFSFWLKNMKTTRYFKRWIYILMRTNERWYDKRPWMRRRRDRISTRKKKKEIYTGYFNNVKEEK